MGKITNKDSALKQLASIAMEVKCNSIHELMDRFDTGELCGSVIGTEISLILSVYPDVLNDIYNLQDGKSDEDFC